MPTDLRFPAPDGTVFQTRAALLCVRNNRLLTTWDTRYPEFYTLPGGAIQTSESAESAARREWCEETGHEVAELKLRGVVENFFSWEDRECHEFGFFFVVEWNGDLPAHVLDNPQVKFRWLPVAELNQYLIYPRCIAQLLQLPEEQIGHFVTDERK